MTSAPARPPMAAIPRADTSRRGPLPDRAEATARSHVPGAHGAGGAARDLPSARALGWPTRRDEEEEIEESGPGWKASFLLNLILLCTPLGLVIALPPVLDCRAREARFGFFAGDSVSKCSSRGIGQRLTLLDDRIKMLVRGSGR